MESPTSVLPHPFSKFLVKKKNTDTVKNKLGLPNKCAR